MRLTFVPLAVLAATLSGCASPVDNAPPVATPSVSVSRTDAAIGSPIDITYRFAVAADAPAFAESHWVFVHFLDTDGELMWTDDHQPPTATTQWKPGETIEYTRTMFVPKFPYVGETRIEVGLFSPATGDRLPLAGESAGQRAVQVGTFNIRLQSDNVFIVFREGWHETETSGQGAGISWQWTRKDGTLSFRNPRRESTLFIEVDQPVEALSGPQQVEIRTGGAVVDSFTLPWGRRELRRIRVTPAQLGEGENVDVTISVDQTFVPSTVPALKSTDPRELGIRVFRAYVEPTGS
jgi:hypothetical protein